MRLAFFQPDIPQNLGAAIRLGACMRAPIEVIEPCAFPLSDAALRRAAMDYHGKAQVIRRPSFAAFMADDQCARFIGGTNIHFAADIAITLQANGRLASSATIARDDA